MAVSRFLMQGTSEDQGHLSAVLDVLNTEAVASSTVSVAFATAKGVSLVAPGLARHKDKTTVFVGVRNGVSSLQALKALLDLGVKLYCVDTGSCRFIFHPKVYFAEGTAVARLFVGSANLTLPGLGSSFAIHAAVRRHCCS